MEDFESSVQEIMKGVSQSIVDNVELSKNEMRDILSGASQGINGTVEGITGELNRILHDNTLKFETVINRTTDRLDELVNKTTDNFRDEIAMIKDYLINSDKLIRNNQKTITDTQRNIEKSLNEMLVQVVEETDRNRENLSIVMDKVREFIDQSSQELYGMKELNNTINIKTDYILNKVKEEQKKSKMRFIISLIINVVTLLGVLGVVGMTLIGG
jgi:uncharacterized coiled-coil protein SlyX